MKKLFHNLNKRPIIIIYLALTTLALCVAEQFNQFTKNFGSWGKLFGTDYTLAVSDIAVWFKNRATDPRVATVSVIVVIFMTVALAAVASLIYSGAAYITYIQTYSTEKGLDTKKQKSSSVLFKEGVNKRFVGMMVYFIVLFASSLLILALLAFGSMPMSIAIRKVIDGDASAMVSMIILMVLTVLVGFFVVITYTMIMTFLMPSMIAFKRGGLIVTFKMVFAYFWYLVPRTFAFLAYNLAITCIMLFMNYGSGGAMKMFLALIINFVLKLIGILVYTNYSFTTYIEMKDDMFD